jgi:hypothetical protein
MKIVKSASGVIEVRINGDEGRKFGPAIATIEPISHLIKTNTVKLTDEESRVFQKHVDDIWRSQVAQGFHQGFIDG